MISKALYTLLRFHIDHEYCILWQLIYTLRLPKFETTFLIWWALGINGTCPRDIPWWTLIFSNWLQWRIVIIEINNCCGAYVHEWEKQWNLWRSEPALVEKILVMHLFRHQCQRYLPNPVVRNRWLQPSSFPLRLWSSPEPKAVNFDDCSPSTMGIGGWARNHEGSNFCFLKRFNEGNVV